MSFPRVRLGELLHLAERWEEPAPGRTYRQLGVRLWGRGAYERPPLDGSGTRYARLNRVEAGDVVFNKIWARHGSVAVVPPALSGCYVSSEFPSFRPNRDRLEPGWFHWITKTRAFWSACDLASQGTSGKNRIRPEAILAIEVPAPEIGRQRRLTERIELLASQIETARGLAQQSVKQREALLPRGISQVFDRLVACPLVPIRTLGTDGQDPIQTGPFGAQLHASEFVEQGVPVLNVGNVSPDGLRLERLDHVTREKAAQLSRYVLQPGDLLFARTGATLGKVGVVPDGCRGWLMTGHLFRIRFDAKRVDADFACAAFVGAHAVHEQIFSQVRGATRPGYNTTLLGRIRLPLPPLDQQQRIARALTAFRAWIERLSRQQAEVASQIEALLDVLVSRAVAVGL